MFEPVTDLVLAPGLWLGLGLALLYSALFYGWRGGGRSQLVGDLLAGVIGFLAGQIVATALNNQLGVVGQLQVLAGSLASLAALWLRRQVAASGRKSKITGGKARS